MGTQRDGDEVRPLKPKLDTEKPNTDEEEELLMDAFPDMHAHAFENNDREASVGASTLLTPEVAQQLLDEDEPESEDKPNESLFCSSVNVDEASLSASSSPEWGKRE